VSNKKKKISLCTTVCACVQILRQIRSKSGKQRSGYIAESAERGHLTEAKQACNQNQLRQARWCSET